MTAFENIFYLPHAMLEQALHRCQRLRRHWASSEYLSHREYLSTQKVVNSQRLSRTLHLDGDPSGGMKDNLILDYYENYSFHTIIISTVFPWPILNVRPQKALKFKQLEVGVKYRRQYQDPLLTRKYKNTWATLTNSWSLNKKPTSPPTDKKRKKQGENVNISCEQLGGVLKKAQPTPPTDPTGNWEEK